jgi:hypothetical protein
MTYPKTSAKERCWHDDQWRPRRRRAIRDALTLPARWDAIVKMRGVSSASPYRLPSLHREDYA